MGVVNRIKRGWNAFANEEKERLKPKSDRKTTAGSYNTIGVNSRNNQMRMPWGSDRSILASVLNRIAVDVAVVDMRHVRVDDKDRFKNRIRSGLDSCLTKSANIDQSAQPFRQDIAMSLMELGTIAIVAVDTDDDPNETGAIDVKSLRVGKIVNWAPRHVDVELYDDREDEGGQRRTITMRKENVAIVENPLYTVMNEYNSTLKRLIRKLNMLDAIDEQSSSGKLDLIIQLPWSVKSETKKSQAMKRREDLEFQMKDSQYGIGYIDATEKITQLNRPAENNMLKQVEYLTNRLYSELGITPAVFDGTADEAAMLNYHNRTIAPILVAITEALTNAFISKTGYTQGQRVQFVRDPFKLLPLSEVAEIADKMTRNEILTSNEMRATMGFEPVDDPKADQLVNSNLNQSNDAGPLVPEVVDAETEEVDGGDDGSPDVSEGFDDIESELSALIETLQKSIAA